MAYRISPRAVTTKSTGRDNVAVTQTRLWPRMLARARVRLDRDGLTEAWMLATARNDEQGRGCMTTGQPGGATGPAGVGAGSAGIVTRGAWSEKAVQPSKRSSDRPPPEPPRPAGSWLPTPPASRPVEQPVSLATSIWYSNPDCKPIVYRQANGIRTGRQTCQSGPCSPL